MASTDKIILKILDGKSFEVEKAVALRSGLICQMIEEEIGVPAECSLPNIPGRILSKVIEYCKMHVDDTDRDGDDLKAWDADFVKVDQATLYDLIMAADYLDIKDLLDLTCQAVADMIKGKTPEGIAKTFSINDELTPEEEEEIRRECQWEFDGPSPSGMTGNEVLQPLPLPLDSSHELKPMIEGPLLLKSSDGKSFEVEKAVALQSRTIYQMIKKMEVPAKEIPLPNVTGRILSKVIEYCKMHVNDTNRDGDDLKAWDADFVKVDQDTLYNLIMAANYLNIRGLLHLTSRTLADMLKGKTPEEIQRTLGLKKDFTPEKEEEIRREKQWAFDPPSPSGMTGKKVVEGKISNDLDLTGAEDRFIPEEKFNQTDAISLILKDSSIEVISGSIGKLKHLEYLNAKNSWVTELPPEVASLTKLRDIRIYRYDKDPPTESPNLIGFKARCSVKEFECLEKLYFVESDISWLNDLGNLTKLTRLGITEFRKGHGQSLCTSFGKLKALKSLRLHALDPVETLDLHYQTSPPETLQLLYLHGRLEKLPDWIYPPSLGHLRRLILKWSHLKEDLLETLGQLKALEELQLHRAYDGEQLNFKNMQFPLLKNFLLHDLEGLRSMSLEQGTLPCLEILTISRCQWLKEIPSDIENILSLKKLTLSDMSPEFYEKAKEDHKKEDYGIFKHIEEVYFTRWRAGYWETLTSQGTEDVKASPGNPE